jgi:hypothetical protein
MLGNDKVVLSQPWMLSLSSLDCDKGLLTYHLRLFRYLPVSLVCSDLQYQAHRPSMTHGL